MSDKITLATLTSFKNDSTAVTQTNANNALITNAIDNTLSRNGTSPNQMDASLDMNSNQIINLPAPISPGSPIRLQDLQAAGQVTIPLPPEAHQFPYTPSFTGAAATFVGSKLDKYLSVSDFGASGSTATTTGSITSGTSTLTLASALDFQNNQYVRIDGAGPTPTVGSPSGLTVTQQGAAGTTTYTYTICSYDGMGGVLPAVTSVTITNGNATLSTNNFNHLSWTAGSGNPMYIVFGRAAGSMQFLNIVRGGTTYDDHGSPAFAFAPASFLPFTPPTVTKNQYLITKISSGGTTTILSLANTASNTVASAVINHDDTTPIQTAINSLGSVGGEVQFPSALYNVTSTINIGNGSGVTRSTRNNINLKGIGGGGETSYIGPTGAAQIQWLGTGACVAVNYCFSWGMQNFVLNCVVPSTTSSGLFVQNGYFGYTRGLLVSNFNQIGIFVGLMDTTTAANNNRWEDIQIWMNSWTFSFGIKYDGASSTVDVYGDVWSNLNIIPGDTSQICMDFGACDTILFYGVLLNPVSTGCTAIRYDYSTNTRGWPGNIEFFHIDTEGNGIVNVGSPPAITPPNHLPSNRMISFGTGNGSAYPWLPQIANMDFPNAPVFTFSTLPPVANTTGVLCYITDGAASPTWGTNAAGGGSTKTLVWSNGSNWRVLGV